MTKFRAVPAVLLLAVTAAIAPAPAEAASTVKVCLSINSHSPRGDRYDVLPNAEVWESDTSHVTGDYILPGSCKSLPNDAGQARVKVDWFYSGQSYRWGYDGRGYGECKNVDGVVYANPANSLGTAHLKTYSLRGCTNPDPDRGPRG